MNQKTTRFNQDAFVAHDALPGDVSPALSNDIISHGVRTDALHITSYTAGDTSGKPDSGLPEVAEANTPKRISRKYIPIQSNGGKGQDAVFPQNSDESEFTWKPTGFQNDNFMSVKDAKPVNAVAPEKGGPSRHVMGLLKQLGHSDAGDVAPPTQNVTNQIIQEKAIVVNLSPTSLTNVEFNNHISTITNDNQTHNHNTYSIKSDVVVSPGSILTNRTNRNTEQSSYTKVNTDNSIDAKGLDSKHTEPQSYTRDGSSIDVKGLDSKHTEPQSYTRDGSTEHSIDIELMNRTVVSNDKPIARDWSSATNTDTASTQSNHQQPTSESIGVPSKASELPIAHQSKSHQSNKSGTNVGRNDNVTHNTMPSVTTQSDAEVYEQVRTILGEGRQDWKQVIKAAKSATSPVSPNSTAVNNSTVATQENQIEQMIQHVLSQEANSRVELEHVLTHKFSTELTNMQQSMNKKIQDLREAFSNFMMR